MWSYTKLRDRFALLAGDPSSATVKSLGDDLMNDSYMRVCSSAAWPFLEGTDTATTVASQQAYDEPVTVGNVISVTVTVGTSVYRLTPCPNRRAWERLNESSTQTSDFPQYFWREAGQTKIYPTPASAGNTVTWTFRKNVRPLSMADYTTGNVSAVTNGSRTVTGSGTTWTAPMAGRHIAITATDTAGQSGDLREYEIASVGSATSLTLSRDYEGLTVTGNTAYTLGEVPLLPADYRSLPLWDALEVYFTSVFPDSQKAQLYGSRKREMEASLRSAHLDSVEGADIADEEDILVQNPNLYPSNLT